MDNLGKSWRVRREREASRREERRDRRNFGELRYAREGERERMEENQTTGWGRERERDLGKLGKRKLYLRGEVREGEPEKKDM